MTTPDERAIAATAIPDEVDTEKISADHEKSKEALKEGQAKEDKEGSLKDYFVSCRKFHGVGSKLTRRPAAHLHVC